MKLYRENEETSSDDKNKRVAFASDLVVTPEGNVKDAIAAFEDIDNYGIYVSRMRNKKEIDAAVEKHFGPPGFKRKTLEKERGKPFPIKTKQAVDDFIKSILSKPSLLKYKVEGNSIIFPQASNPGKEETKKVIQTVLDNAKIKFSLSKKENIKEIIRQYVKEAIQRA